MKRPVLAADHGSRAIPREAGGGIRKVLIVEDSPMMQRLVQHALDAHPGLSVVGVAPDAYAAREMIKRLAPDVLVLDVEMPRMSGIDFLSRVMSLRPMPVVMFSSVTQIGSDAAIRALVLGAVDCVAKPESGVTPEVLADLAERVVAAADSRVLRSGDLSATPPRVEAPPARRAAWSGEIILIGASTGGVNAVETVLSGLPPESPPVVIAQHMPDSFLGSFARRLDRVLPQTVVLARDGMVLEPGHIFLAPGGTRHTALEFAGRAVRCREVEGPKRNGHCPSVDVLFQSAVDHAERIRAAILTGLGADGARGIADLRRAGAFTIGQDEESCVVYGMPRAAAEMDGLDRQVPLDAIAAGLVAGPGRPRARRASA